MITFLKQTKYNVNNLHDPNYPRNSTLEINRIMWYLICDLSDYELSLQPGDCKISKTEITPGIFGIALQVRYTVKNGLIYRNCTGNRNASTNHSILLKNCRKFQKIFRFLREKVKFSQFIGIFPLKKELIVHASGLPLQSQ